MCRMINVFFFFDNRTILAPRKSDMTVTTLPRISVYRHPVAVQRNYLGHVVRECVRVCAVIKTLRPDDD